MLKILSLFDGISGAKQALNNLGIKSEYYASEIDKWAIQISQKNHPNVIQIGDINLIDFNHFKNVDLLIGGFPCQSFSGAGKQKSFEDDRGKLFFKCVEALKIIKPKYFIFENVASMKTIDQDLISEKLGVKPIMINSNLLTAQNRKRLYWTNLKVEQPENNKQFLKDILEELPSCPIGIEVRKKSNCLRVGGQFSPFESKQIWDSPFQRINKKGNLKKGIQKAACLTAGANSGGNHSDMDLIHSSFITRRYSVGECEKLQGFPVNYCLGVSNSQAFKALGNSFTVPIIEHILKHIISANSNANS